MKMVQMASTGERFNHWILMLSFFILLLTGFGFTFDSLNWLNKIFGGNHLAKDIHEWAGLVFSFSLIFTISSYLAESISFSADDSEWISKLGGYMSGKEVPPSGRLNAGQKIFYLLTLISGIAIAVTGFVLWAAGDNKSLMAWNLGIHNLTFVIFATMIPLHGYLATAANPGTFRIMTKGTVPLEWAKKTHAKWVKDMGLD